MGDFLIGLIIPIGILIVLGTIFYFVFRKKGTPKVNKGVHSSQGVATVNNAAHAPYGQSSLSKIIDKMVLFIFYICIIVFGFWALKILIKTDLFDGKDKTEENVNTNDVTQNTYSKSYLLRKGEVIRVNIPSGYKCDCSGGGKKYYHQEQNGIKNIMGNGNFILGGKNSAYFDLSYYDEEITVVVDFKKL